MNESIHEETQELLPDYVLGALDDEALSRVAWHLDGCPICRPAWEELLETVSLLAPVAHPRPAARQALLVRVAAREVAPPAAGESPAAATWPAPPERATTTTAERRRDRPQRRQIGPARLALAAVLVATILSLAAWNVVLQRQLGERDTIAALLSNPAAAHPLTDSELSTGAAGFLYADPQGNVALMMAYRLPALPPDQQYQIWLFTEDGERESGGLFAVDAEGNGQVLIRAPAPFAKYWAVGVSAEPAEGSPAPTSPLAIGGWIQ